MEQIIQNINEPEATRLFKFKYKHRLERKQEKDTNSHVIPKHIYRSLSPNQPHRMIR